MDKYTLAREIATLIPQASGPARGHLQAAHDLLLRSSDHGITDRDLERLPPGDQLADPTAPGLIARHSKRSGVVWLMRLRTDGRDKLVRIATWPQTSPEAARQLWRDVRAGALTLGTLQARTAENVSQRLTGPVRLSQAVQFYLDRYAEPFSSASTYRHAKANLERFVKLAGDPPVEQVTRGLTRDLLVEIERKHGPQAATKTRNSLSRCWQCCQGTLKELRLTSRETLVDVDLPNPAIGIKFAASQDQFPLSPQEMDAYWVNLPHVQGVPDVVKDLLQLQALTISRIGEVAGIRNEWVNLQDGWIDLPRVKNGGDHRLMLGSEARRIVERHYDKDREFLFTGPRQGKPPHPNSVNTYVREHLKQLGIHRTGEMLKLKGQPNTHAIRRFGYTHLQEQGVSQGVIERAVAHRPRGVKAKYGWSAELWPQVREALALLEDRLLAAILER